MANIQARKNRDGEIISYSIRVYKGRDTVSGKQLKPYAMTWDVPEGWSEKTARKEALKQAALFEKQCRDGLIGDSRQTFADYAQYVIRLKERAGKKHRTIVIYRDLMTRIIPAIGYMRLGDIRPQHLNQFYDELGRCGARSLAERATSRVNFNDILTRAGLTGAELARKAHVCPSSLTRVRQGKSVMPETAEAVARALGQSVSSLFEINSNDKPLTNRTILEYHRFISTVLAEADREMLIPFNPASKATPPKAAPHKANYFQEEELLRIRDALEEEGLKWKVMVHLLLVTGCRRGELMGLKWKVVDWENSQIHIEKTLLYSRDIGVYEDTTKTEESNRYIKLPAETMALLRQYRAWYEVQKREAGSRWKETGFLFVHDNGVPLNPESLTQWLLAFSRRHHLPHINPHAFRHTQASILYFNGVDSVTISKRLGHSKVSTTTDIYSHVMRQADERASECVAEVILR